MDDQDLAFEKLSRLKVGALFMAMGTGKTKIALDLICSKIHKVDYVLWICPFSLKNEIEAERQKWHSELTLDVVGIETISGSDRTYLEVLEKVKKNKTFIVVDESLKIKNIWAKRTGRVLGLGKYAEYKLILNGTPITKNIMDLWTQMDFLSPKILNMSYNQFKNTYCEYYTKGKMKGAIRSYCNIEHLISVIRPYIYECELDLDKDKTYYGELYSLSEDELLEYQEIKERTLRRFEELDDIDFYRLVANLQSYYSKTISKQKALKNLVESIGEKTIIFVKYLSSIPENALKITGDESMKQRKENIDKFKNDENIKELYITYGCGAFGLNLQFCKTTIFADHTWDYAERVQAEARTYRKGQEEDVTYYDLKCNVGLEDMILTCQQRKGNLSYDIKKEIEKQGVEKWLKSI